MNARKKWFRDRIGKEIFRTKRTKGTCDCPACMNLYLNGMFINDKTHADYLYIFESETDFKYFDSKEERDEFEKGISYELRRL
jgi:hypothetical protein